jgi:hypothetical protein
MGAHFFPLPFLLCFHCNKVLSSLSDFKQSLPVSRKLKHREGWIETGKGWGAGWSRYTILKQGVCHTMALPITLKGILRQKKNYGNSNTSPCKNIIFKKSSKRNKNPSRYIITL